MEIRYRSFSQNMGFSLVELMVGLTLGLIVTFVITGVWGVFEKQKSTTVSGATAQESGLIALTQIEQEIRNAGVGFNNSTAFECSTIYSYYDGTTPAPGLPTTGGFAPVTITNGSTATSSDSIEILKSSEFLGALPATITDGMPQPSSELNVSFTKGFTIGQLILVSQSGSCTVMQVTQVQDAALKIQHNPSGSDPSYNPAGNFYNTAPGNTWPTFTTGAKILNFGTLSKHTLSIDSSFNLVMNQVNIPQTGTAPAALLLANNIVNMQAQYGIADAGQQNVNAWVEPTGTWATLDSTRMKRIKAVRLALVARSAKPESENVTGTCSNNAGTNYGPCAWGDTSANPAPLIDLRNNTDWQKYRYRVYQIIIPLRNVIWAEV